MATACFNFTRHGGFSVSHQAVRKWWLSSRDCGSHPLLRKRTSAPGYPMKTLSGSNVLIIGDAPGLPELRERLIMSGANVQVVSIAGAMIAIRQKQIDSAFIAASLDESTRALCQELAALEIAQIFVAPDETTPLSTAVAAGAKLNTLRRKMRVSAYS
jgi:hypothetical protein